MKIKVSEATNPQLGWLVAKCKGMTASLSGVMGYYTELRDKFCPSTDWAQGGPIIEREEISVEQSDKYGWIASRKGPCSIGPTPLIAAMRCYVTSKLGDEVEVPNEL